MSHITNIPNVKFGIQFRVHFTAYKCYAILRLIFVGIGTESMKNMLKVEYRGIRKVIRLENISAIIGTYGYKIHETSFSIHTVIVGAFRSIECN